MSSPAIETRNGAMLPRTTSSRSGSRRHAGRAAPRASGRRQRRAHAAPRRPTWTEAPGETPRRSWPTSPPAVGSVGGDEGSTLPLAADIYGVIAQDRLSLVGLQRHEISWARRALGVAFSVVTAPFEFIPLIIAARQKQRERDWVEWCHGDSIRPSARRREARATAREPAATSLKRGALTLEP